MGAYPFRSALITGASSGIGRSMAELLAADGVATVAVARRADRLEELAERFDAIEPMVADLTDDGGLASVATRVRSDAFDLVVNNAGMGTAGPFDTVEPQRIEQEIDLNVGAVTLLSKAALETMVPRRQGWLLNVSSVVAFQPAPKSAVYAASKAFVTSLSESLHEEVKSSGVHVTALCPGFTRTEFGEANDANWEQYPDWAFADALDVARSGLRDVVKNKAVSVPGLMYKTLVTTSDLIPRGLRRRLSGRVQR